MKRVKVIETLTFSGAILFALLLAGGASCTPGDGSAPEAPAVTPQGPEITIEPGETQPVRASADRAKRYEWSLQGEGELSESTGPTTLFTAPEEGGSMAIITVTAHNDHGSSSPTAITVNIQERVIAPVGAFGVPAGWMSGGNPSSFLSLTATATNCHGTGGCLRIGYRPGGVWGGIYWWPLTCGDSGTAAAWSAVRAESCVISVLNAGGFEEVKLLTFWARGDSGGERIEFKIGGHDIAPIPGRSMGTRALTQGWEKYEIDLEGVDVTRVIGLFAWVASDLDNPNGATFYLDEIQFEGVK